MHQQFRTHTARCGGSHRSAWKPAAVLLFARRPAFRCRTRGLPEAAAAESTSSRADLDEQCIDDILNPQGQDEPQQKRARRVPKLNRSPPPIHPLPPLQECKHFVNLTNGIEALGTLHELQLPYSFVRLQSTACEQQKWESLICSVDANLLAMGQCCIVYDYGSRHRATGNPRAIWVGLEFIRYVLTRVWFGREAADRCGALTRGYNAQYDDVLKRFSRGTLRQMRYFRKFLREDLTEIRLHGAYSLTTHDDDASFYRSLLYNPQGAEGCSASSEADLPAEATARYPGKPVDVHGSEAVLAAHGLAVYYRGLSNVEYKAQGIDRSAQPKSRRSSEPDDASTVDS